MKIPETTTYEKLRKVLIHGMDIKPPTDEEAEMRRHLYKIITNNKSAFNVKKKAKIQHRYDQARRKARRLYRFDYLCWI